MSHTSTTRTEINRANAAHSTGPKSVEGKARSARNSFKHGLYSQALIIHGEDPAELDKLRQSLRAEHQPVNTTEEILVDELAQHFWRMRRYREMEARAWTPENFNSWIENGLVDLIQRVVNSAERSFYKALAALTKLQKQRGFVPKKVQVQEPASTSEPEQEVTEHEQIGFVPQKADFEFLVSSDPDDELDEQLTKIAA
jgi:hypothetical protein